MSTLVDAYTHLANTIADTTTFRLVTGSPTRADALTRIHRRHLTEPAGRRYARTEIDALRPYIVIHSERCEQPLLAPGTYGESGQFSVMLEDKIDPDNYDDPGAAADAIASFADALRRDMLALSGTAEHLMIRDIQIDDPQLGHPDEAKTHGRWTRVYLTVEWGDA